MKTTTVAAMAVAVGLVIAVTAWRQNTLEEELVGLRASVDKARSQRASVALAQSPKAVDNSGVALAFSPAAAVPDAGAPGPGTGANPDRLGELATVVDGQADVMETVLARFAEWDERERRAAKRKELEAYMTYELAMKDGLNALDKSQSKGLKYQATIAGQTGTSKQLQEQEAAQLRLTEAVTFLGMRGDDAVMVENQGRSTQAPGILVTPDSARPEITRSGRSTLRREK